MPRDFNHYFLPAYCFIFSSSFSLLSPFLPFPFLLSFHVDHLLATPESLAANANLNSHVSNISEE